LLCDEIRLAQEFSDHTKGIKEDLTSFLFGAPTTFLLTLYNDSIQAFFMKSERTEEVNYGNSAIFSEAIRQQLTTGIGLLCPFWIHAPDRCCSSFNRAYLEKVWSRTCPDSSCTLWEQLGCLAKGGASCNAKS
jgi:hypothetical protein